MKQKGIFIACTLAGLLAFDGNALGCGCGGGGKHHKKHHHGGGVGVGGSVDLGGIGRRSREADPFATGGGNASTPKTQEKQKSKKQTNIVSNPLEGIKLTGPKAKKTVASADSGGAEAND